MVQYVGSMPIIARPATRRWHQQNHTDESNRSTEMTQDDIVKHISGPVPAQSKFLDLNNYSLPPPPPSSSSPVVLVLVFLLVVVVVVNVVVAAADVRAPAPRAAAARAPTAAADTFFETQPKRQNTT
jgi:hypothetical protein